MITETRRNEISSVARYLSVVARVESDYRSFNGSVRYATRRLSDIRVLSDIMEPLSIIQPQTLSVDIPDALRNDLLSVAVYLSNLATADIDYQDFELSVEYAIKKLSDVQVIGR